MIDTPDIVCRAMAAPWRAGVQILIERHGRQGEPRERAALTFQPVSPAVETAPSATLSREDAQTLMDDLWQAGLRPTEGTGSAGAFAAQGRHLEDMRALVFKPEAKA